MAACSFPQVKDSSDYSFHNQSETTLLSQVAHKARSIWATIFGITISPVLKVIDIARTLIGNVVRDLFFFPLKCSFIANLNFVKQLMKIEEDYYRSYWDPSKPLDPNLKDHGKVRALFDPPRDQEFSVQTKSGKEVKMTCRIYETKAKEGQYYNFVQVPGIFATISNNIGPTHSYFSSYINSCKNQSDLPPARFIVVSENNLNYKPESMEEAGYILKETLAALNKEFGEIDQVVAHSLGTILLASALKQTETDSTLPKHICFDRGPISVWEASKRKFFGIGCLLYLFVKMGRWDEDLEESIDLFCKRRNHKSSILITGAAQDHHFPGNANLVSSEKLKRNENVQRLLFDVPRQIFHQDAQHNLRPDLLNSNYLLCDTDYMQPSECLSDAIIRHSISRHYEEKQQIA